MGETKAMRGKIRRSRRGLDLWSSLVVARTIDFTQVGWKATEVLASANFF